MEEIRFQLNRRTAHVLKHFPPNDKTKTSKSMIFIVGLLNLKRVILKFSRQDILLRLSRSWEGKITWVNVMGFAKFAVHLSEDLYARGILKSADHLLKMVRFSSA
jgi:hypothetical protein